MKLKNAVKLQREEDEKQAILHGDPEGKTGKKVILIALAVIAILITSAVIVIVLLTNNNGNNEEAGKSAGMSIYFTALS